MASLLIIFSIIYRSLFFSQFNLYTLILTLALIIKLGIPPFHLWIISISLFTDWNILFLLLSIQKVIPIYILSLLEINLLILYFLILFSSYVSTFKIIINLNFKIILSYSSINQIRWILLLITFKNILWLLYFIIYSSILLIISLLFQFLKLSHNFFYNFPSNNNFQLTYIFLFLNIASLPPISFFFIKWFRVFIFIFNSPDIIFLIIIILINSFILIYIYINIIILLIFFYSTKSKIYHINPPYHPLKKLYSIIFISLFFSLIIIII